MDVDCFCYAEQFTRVTADCKQSECAERSQHEGPRKAFNHANSKSRKERRKTFFHADPPLKCEVTEHDFIPAHVLHVAGIRKAGAFIPAHRPVIFPAYPHLIFCGITDILFAEKGPTLKFLHCHVIIPPFQIICI